MSVKSNKTNNKLKLFENASLHCFALSLYEHFFYLASWEIELGLRCIVWLTDFSRDACLCFFKVFICLFNGSVSASGTGQIRLESPCPAMPDTEPTLTGMALCPALYISYQFLGCMVVSSKKNK